MICKGVRERMIDNNENDGGGSSNRGGKSRPLVVAPTCLVIDPHGFRALTWGFSQLKKSTTRPKNRRKVFPIVFSWSVYLPEVF